MITPATTTASPATKTPALQPTYSGRWRLAHLGALEPVGLPSECRPPTGAAPRSAGVATAGPEGRTLSAYMMSLTSDRRCATTAPSARSFREKWVRDRTAGNGERLSLDDSVAK
ncbi:hypothetical protein GCM10022420_008770 [Streptomyces iranensis]